MEKIYNKSELQEILDMYSRQDSTNNAIEQAYQLLTDFVNGNADIHPSALEEFQKIIETFCISVNEEGEQTLNELGAQATARFQSIVDFLENAENIIDENRIYSLTSDQNQIKFDLITLKIYREMGLINPHSFDVSNMTPNQVAETINSINLTDEQRGEYSYKFIDNIIKSPELFEITPPKILTDAYIFIKEQLEKNPTDENLLNRFTILAKRIDYLIKNFAKKVGYFYSDSSNIADIYTGYHKMCNVRNKDLQISKHDNENTKKYKEDVKKSVDETIARLEEIVATYSDMWNLKNLNSEDAEELDARYKEISELLKDFELTDEILSVLAKFEFLDENGKPLPQFIDENGNQQKDLCVLSITLPFQIQVQYLPTVGPTHFFPFPLQKMY